MSAVKVKKALNDDPEGTNYCLKIDIRKFYPTIDHDILKEVIRRKIKDVRLLALLGGCVNTPILYTAISVRREYRNPNRL